LHFANAALLAALLAFSSFFLTLNCMAILLIAIWKQTNNAFDPSAANWVDASRSRLVVSLLSLDMEEIATSPLAVVFHFRPESSNKSPNESLSKSCE